MEMTAKRHLKSGEGRSERELLLSDHTNSDPKNMKESPLCSLPPCPPAPCPKRQSPFQEINGKSRRPMPWLSSRKARKEGPWKPERKKFRKEMSQKTCTCMALVLNSHQRHRGRNWSSHYTQLRLFAGLEFRWVRSP